MLIQWPHPDTRIRAYGIVHSEWPGPRTDADVHAIRDLARRSGMYLCAISVVHPGSDLSLLLASLPSSGIDAVLVPSVVPLAGWLDVVREKADVWTLSPHGRWPRRCAGAATNFIPVSGAPR